MTRYYDSLRVTPQSGKCFAQMIGLEFAGFAATMAVVLAIVYKVPVSNPLAVGALGIAGACVGMLVGAWVALRLEFGTWKP